MNANELALGKMNDDREGMITIEFTYLGWKMQVLRLSRCKKRRKNIKEYENSKCINKNIAGKISLKEYNNVLLCYK